MCSALPHVSALNERAAAARIADAEFEKVKQEKLAVERSKAILIGNAKMSPEYRSKIAKQRNRERANRASAAASRARYVNH